MTKRIIAIAFIFACTAVAWMVLGATIFERSKSSDQHLRGRVSSTWGTSQSQQAPSAFIEKTETRVVEDPARRVPPSRVGGQTTEVAPAVRTELVRTRVPILLEQTRANVQFDLDHRQKGLLWYSTYGVTFSGAYRFRNTADSDAIILEFQLPAAEAV